MSKAKAEQAPEAAKEVVKDKKEISIRSTLTKEEKAILEGDDQPPAGYANSNLQAPEAPAEETKPEAAKVDDKSKPEAPAAAPAAPVTPPSDDSFAKLERELAKPEGKEDLTAFSPREKAYFHQMRRDRKGRQQAETERDQALFKLTKASQPPPPVKKDPFEGRQEDDILTVADIKKLLKEQEETAPKAAESAPQPVQTAKRYLQMCETEARTAHKDDFDAVMELSDELLASDTTALKEISERTAAGENPAEVMYQTIKRHKEFENLFPAAQLRAQARIDAAKPPSPASPPSAPATPTPEDKAKIESANQAQRALEENANRPKTTAHVSAREGKPAEELTFEEINSMSDMEFARLPRSTRQRYLKKYGA